jgi:hypothetical protein
MYHRHSAIDWEMTRIHLGTFESFGGRTVRSKKEALTFGIDAWTRAQTLCLKEPASKHPAWSRKSSRRRK